MVIVSHDESLVTVQVNVWSVAEIDTNPLPPAASTATLVGLNVILGSAEACCVAVKVCPTPLSGVTVIVAVRV